MQLKHISTIEPVEKKDPQLLVLRENFIILAEQMKSLLNQIDIDLVVTAVTLKKDLKSFEGAESLKGTDLEYKIPEMLSGSEKLLRIQSDRIEMISFIESEMRKVLKEIHSDVEEKKKLIEQADKAPPMSDLLKRINAQKSASEKRVVEEKKTVAKVEEDTEADTKKDVMEETKKVVHVEQDSKPKGDSEGLTNDMVKNSIIKTLRRMGGTGARAQVLSAVHRELKGKMSESDMKPYRKGRKELSWENLASRVVGDLRKKGIMAKQETVGVWSLA